MAEFGDPRLPERFWSKVRLENGHWMWVAGQDGKGYGQFHVSGRHSIKAYRYAYEMLVRPVPPGFELDHLCRVRACVYVEHLEVVTRAQNIRRGIGGGGRGGGGRAAQQWAKTHCPAGHPYDEANTYVWQGKSGGPDRHCRTCRRAWHRAAARR